MPLLDSPAAEWLNCCAVLPLLLAACLRLSLPSPLACAVHNYILHYIHIASFLRVSSFAALLGP